MKRQMLKDQQASLVPVNDYKTRLENSLRELRC